MFNKAAAIGEAPAQVTWSAGAHAGSRVLEGPSLVLGGTGAVSRGSHPSLDRPSS